MEEDWLHNTQGGQKVSKPDFSLNVISFLLVLEMGGFTVWLSEHILTRTIPENHVL